MFISEQYKVKREMYFAIMLDRSSGGPGMLKLKKKKKCKNRFVVKIVVLVMIGSSKGGVNIEDVARNTPQYVIKVSLYSCFFFKKN